MHTVPTFKEKPWAFRLIDAMKLDAAGHPIKLSRPDRNGYFYAYRIVGFYLRIGLLVITYRP